MTDVKNVHVDADESENDGNSWTDIGMEDDRSEDGGSQSSSESIASNETTATTEDDDKESDPLNETSTDDDDASDESDDISRNIIADEIIFSRTVFTYHNEVNLIVKNCCFKNAIKFEFYKAATVKFQNCQFYGRKTVIFHEEVSSLDCEEIQCFGPAFYKYYEDDEFSMNFEKCRYFASKICSHRIEINDDDADFEQNAAFNSTKTSDFELFITHVNTMFTTFCSMIERLFSKNEIIHFFKLVAILYFLGYIIS